MHVAPRFGHLNCMAGHTHCSLTCLLAWLRVWWLQVDGFRGASFCSFKTRNEAQAWLDGQSLGSARDAVRAGGHVAQPYVGSSASPRVGGLHTHSAQAGAGAGAGAGASAGVGAGGSAARAAEASQGRGSDGGGWSAGVSVAAVLPSQHERGARGRGGGVHTGGAVLANGARHAARGETGSVDDGGDDDADVVLISDDSDSDSTVVSNYSKSQGVERGQGLQQGLGQGLGGSGNGMRVDGAPAPVQNVNVVVDLTGSDDDSPAGGVGSRALPLGGGRLKSVRRSAVQLFQGNGRGGGSGSGSGSGGGGRGGASAGEQRGMAQRQPPPVPLQGNYFIQFDGGSRGNPGHAGWGCVVVREGGARVHAGCGYSGARETNNTAEYQGCYAGLLAARALGVRRVRIEGDSQLVLR